MVGTDKARRAAKAPSEKTLVDNLAVVSGVSLPTPPKTVDNSGVETPRAGSRLDWVWIATRMKKPRFVFDGRNILNADEMRMLGFAVESIGKAPSDFHPHKDF